MPMHDWTRVEPGIFPAFHHEWISEISRSLNQELLPDNYYALPEQVAAGFGPDVLTLQEQSPDAEPATDEAVGPMATGLQTRPQSTFTAETEAEFYRRKKSSIVVRHISGDRIVAMLEILSPAISPIARLSAAWWRRPANSWRSHPPAHRGSFSPRPTGSRRHSRRHLGASPRGSLSPSRRSAADFGGLRVRPHHTGFHRNHRRGSAPSGYAPVSGTQRLRHGAPGSHLPNRLYRVAETVAKRARISSSGMSKCRVRRGPHNASYFLGLVF
jgi:hypothetical protein